MTVQEGIDYELNKRYFRGPGCALFLAIGLGLIGIFTLSGSWQTAIVLIGLAAIAAVVHFKMRSSNPRSVDASLEAVTQQVRKTAASRIGAFPHAAPPLEVIGFSRIKNTAGPLVQLKEEGGRTRTNWVGGFVAYFSEQQVHIFTTETCITAPAQAEKTVEFFYEDVVSLSAESDQRGSRLSLTVQDGSRYDAPISDVATIDSELAAARELIRRGRS
ncbi:hypothetical protein [Rathayibacter rathayi]|uniref:Uncharacterized protein n=1 Tax=Rathayibacter rathayi TaxID=33887 RepID=A0ABX5A868_RATRA|nr:hypothetical protein [Rathayibacter rathayi]PPF19673.1 hypothetical protein C5C34_14890 [Rathayibacter rathayi]PPF42452.1 hypothetical protein C5C08_14930 [Rathayibacter rathayi]PPF75101.1 hypothetical protein C5C14_14960 [Rathayibacter rathayi]PPG09825.1 hypothetical protein C5C11_14940 [Rathayibacter rathayi]PPG47082.1 hypothetical protein C5C20_02310 [Rathayibacter rathayi]